MRQKIPKDIERSRRMLKDIELYDNPAPEKIDRESTCTWGFACSHHDCPVYLLEGEDGRDMVAEGFVKTNYHDDVISCAFFKPKALSALNFLSRMGVCASAILCLCTVFQVHLAVTVAFSCSAAAFWQLWKWLEGKKAL
jgi:hypothetical protein